ncbi:MAG: DegT/DnrJ/EryC1/StrS family aminotransferase [Lachnospiraceae bacterium]|nr:DegT/DnrJ/EryC1/StrS family aminotransferase [Lachnospiraceae bacterium]
MFKKKFEAFENKIWLSSPTMHGEELEFIKEAYDTNWMSTVGKNLDEVEKVLAGKTGCSYAVALSSGTAALHLSVRLAGEKLYGSHAPNKGVLQGHRVFCSDMTFDATVNPVAYEGGEAVFIDGEYDTWNMDPIALEQAFLQYPDTKLIIVAHLYGVPAKIDEIRSVAEKYGALIIEDAAESLGAEYKGKPTGCLGDYNIISFNGNKIITGSAGGMFLTDSEEDAKKVRKWSTQARESAPWYEHEELGYNYRMSNVIAGVIRGQIPYLREHIAAKKAIYERYEKGFAGLPVKMNPFVKESSVPNYWLSCITIDPDAMCREVRSGTEYLFTAEGGKSCPMEILDAISSINAEGRPIWKPMHSQPVYRNNAFITRDGNGRARTNAYIKGGDKGNDGLPLDIGMDIFQRGLCLPSDNKMSPEEQDRIIETVKACFE